MAIDVYSREDLETLGMSDRAVARAVAAGRAVRLRPGRFVNAAEWRALHVEAQQRVRAEAARQAAERPPVFALATAAAVHGLPLFRVVDDRVHVLSRTERAAPANRLVVRHEDAYTDDELIEVDGLVVTRLDRTVFDLIRLLPAEAGVALADAALRAAADGEALRAAVAERIARAPGARGIRRARAVLAFADERSESPGESASRWFLRVLGFRTIEIQVGFPGPDGREIRIDFRFRRGWGEFDGAAKYTEPAYLRGRPPQQVLLDEKRREDWVRGRSQEPFVRWMDRDMPTPRALGAHLAGFGIVPD
ncbi:hypothetical protein [Microbacterium marinilacus]|uniref:Transcriptional regulator, AbiEi antitoxin, Type IV TA system n=1 Tax=Microbacterium marinilacus TaxID=415209 RepID=A0ABP7B9Z7_9MICO|nr:hypothetical protein [Microbacterium marinilacus]MBY0687162.1 hypothetical protein [Microbacterium marinilacus]